MTIVTLTTDFGERDGFVGILKGVIWGLAPQVQIADLSHSIAPQNVLEGALVLGRAAPYFPPGTVHLAVVDPGVGTARRPLAAQVGSQFFVGPDNGLCTLLLEAAEAAGAPVHSFCLDKPDFWRPTFSQTFHDRDIFAPVAAHLAAGSPLEALGTALTDPVRLTLPRPERTPEGWRAHILGWDHFGNLTTDLPAAALAGQDVSISLQGHTIHGLVQTYGEQPPGALVALADSQGQLELAVVNGSAAERLGAQVGEGVEIRLPKRPA
jgi:hypothetical protein